MKQYRFLPLGLMMAISSAFAASNQVGDSVTYNFSGRLLAATPCRINNDMVISVPFGNVAVNKLDSRLYVREINYTLDCGTANTVSMVFRAPQVLSDVATFASDVDGLWVKVLKDGLPLELNKVFTVDDPQKPPKLEIELVKDPSMEPEAKAFTATATLMAEYF